MLTACFLTLFSVFFLGYSTVKTKDRGITETAPQVVVKGVGWVKDLLFVYLYFLKPLTPRSDQDRISPYNINQISDENKENINLGIISWSETQFSELTS